MSTQSLNDLLATVSSPVELLRNSQVGPNVYPGVPAEFTNWRDEQLAWQNTCVLFDQSFHMADLAVEGPGALELLSHLGVNSFEGFSADRAKQFVPCTPDGYVIGDVILFALGDDRYNLVGRSPVLNWISYHAETGGYDVSVELDQRTALRTDGRRKSYRFQVQGPNAMKVIEQALGESPPELRFFRMTTLTLAGKTVRALRHGMVGQPGWELFGPWDDREAVLDALLAAGEEHRAPPRRRACVFVQHPGVGLDPLAASRRVLRRSRCSRIATGCLRPAMRRMASIGGSFESPDIEDYYFTPWDLGYGHLVKFDHDFIGREALERMVERRPSPQGHARPRERATCCTRSGRCSRRQGAAKFMDWPSAVYSMHPFDKVTVDGEVVGVSTWIGYSANEGKMLTLAVVDAAHAEPGTEVTFVWGEPDGGSSKPTVERHVQTEIRAIVSPVPYVEAVRKEYAPGGWRAATV